VCECALCSPVQTSWKCVHICLLVLQQPDTSAPNQTEPSRSSVPSEHSSGEDLFTLSIGRWSEGFTTAAMPLLEIC